MACHEIYLNNEERGFHDSQEIDFSISFFVLMLKRDFKEFNL